MPVFFYPLTADRWADFEQLFGPRGAYGGCWCMWWRLRRAQFERQQGEQNRLAMKALVDEDRVPGILGYLDDQPVAWCSVAPRSEFGALNRSRVLRPVDDEEVWSLVCFFVAKPQRRTGILSQLIGAAVTHVRGQGGAILEAYPSCTRSENASPATTFMGFPEVFAAAGFSEVAQPSPSKRIFRYTIV